MATRRLWQRDSRRLCRPGEMLLPGGAAMRWTDLDQGSDAAGAVEVTALIRRGDAHDLPRCWLPDARSRRTQGPPGPFIMPPALPAVADCWRSRTASFGGSFSADPLCGGKGYPRAVLSVEHL